MYRSGLVDKLVTYTITYANTNGVWQNFLVWSLLCLYATSVKQAVSPFSTRNVKTQPAFLSLLSTMTDCKGPTRNCYITWASEQRWQKKMISFQPANHLHRGGLLTRMRMNTSAWHITSPDAAVVTSPYHVNCQANFIFNAYFIYVC